MARRSLVLFLVLSFVAAMSLTAFTNPCAAGDEPIAEGGEPGTIDPGCEPVTPTPFILDLFWFAVNTVAGSIAAVL